MAIIVSPARRCLSDFANRCFPFGDDTVARNVLKNFKGNQKNIKILFLQCQDLKNVLCSTASKNLQKDCTLDIHLNTVCPLSLARNILLLKVILSPEFNPENSKDLNYFWDLWYNATWSKSTVDRFLTDVQELIESLPDNIHSKLNHKESSQLKTTLEGWVTKLKLKGKQESITKKMLQKRMNYILSVATRLKSIDSGIYKDTDLWLQVSEHQASWEAAGMKIHGFPQSLKDNITKEIELYFKSGNSSPTAIKIGDLQLFNPTLLEPNTLEWRVNATSCPFTGYSPLQPDQLENPADFGVVTRHCQKVLKDLLISYRKIKDNIEFYIHADDDLQFCLEDNSEKFDVIDSSSLADDVGLANLILACFRKLDHHNDALLLTESVDWGKVGPTVINYLEETLCAPLTMFPTIYGLRLMNQVELGNEKLHMACSSVEWPPANLCWSPALRLENAPLCQSAAIERCLKQLEKKCFLNEADPNILYKNGECGFHRYTPLTHHLVLARLTGLGADHRTSFFNPDVSPQFTLARKSLRAWSESRPVKLMVTSHRFTPEIADLFEKQRLTFQEPPLRLALIPTRYLAKRPSKIQSPLSKNDFIYWAAEKSGVHFMDNFDVHFERDANGRPVSVRVAFLLPVTLDLSLTHSAVLVDLYTGWPRMFLGPVILFKEQIFSDDKPISKWPCQLPEILPVSSSLKAIECQESEKDYHVTVKLFSNREPQGLKVSTNQVLPCESTHVVTLSLEEPEGVQPLSLTFPYPVLVNRIQTTLNSSERSVVLSLPKSVNEPWPCRFTGKLKWKVDQLIKWRHSTYLLMAHSAGMVNFESMEAILEGRNNLTKFRQMPPLLGIRSVVGELLNPLNEGCENYVAYVMNGDRHEQVWQLRVHFPILEAPDGFPMLLVSAFDHVFAKQLVTQGHFKEKQLREDFDRIYDRKRRQDAKELVFATQETADLFRYILRLNSTKMMPSSWQENHLPLGKYSPYLATYISPLYLDKKDENGDCSCEGDPASMCSFCLKGSKDGMKRCGKCKAVYYCSTACQKSDWPKHKLECCVDDCSQCRMQSKDMKRCSKCNTGSYCSSKCEVDHWPVHKQECLIQQQLDPVNRTKIQKLMSR